MSISEALWLYFIPPLFWFIYILASDYFSKYGKISLIFFYQKFHDFAFTLSWYFVYKIQSFLVLFWKYHLVISLGSSQAICCKSNKLSFISNLLFSLRILSCSLGSYSYENCILFPCFYSSCSVKFPGVCLLRFILLSYWNELLIQKHKVVNTGDFSEITFLYILLTYSFWYGFKNSCNTYIIVY